MKKVLIAIAVLFSLVWGAWLIALPTDVILRAVEDSVASDGVSVGFTGFRKGLFYNIRCESVDLLVNGDRVFSVNDVRSRLEFSPLLALKAVVPFKGSAGGGDITGSVVLDGKGYRMSADARGVDVSELGLYPLTGVNAGGILSAEARFNNNTGKVKFSVKQAVFEAVPIMGFKLPLDLFRTVRGALYVDRGLVEVESLALEGEGIYARVTGNIRNRNVDLKLELMPEDDTFPDPMYKNLLQPYRVARGHYVIPIQSRFGG